MAAPPPTYNPLLGPSPAAQLSQPPTVKPAAPKPAAPKPSAPKPWTWWPTRPLGLPFPGTFDQLRSDIRWNLAFQHVHSGARVAVSKPVSGNFQVSHTIDMGDTPRYLFGVTYVGEPIYPDAPEYASPFIYAQIDGQGSLMANMQHWINQNVKAKALYQAQQDRSHAEIGFDYKGSDFSASIKAINPDIVNEMGIWSANYLQSITKNFAVGGELMYQYQSGLEMAVMGFGGRYKSDKTILAAEISANGIVGATYMHRVNEKIALLADLEIDIGQRESIAAVGYHFDLRQNAVRGSINSKGVIHGVLENKLAPGLSFIISGALDHVTGKNDFGLGFVIGQ